MPIISSSYKPPFLFGNGHIQTIIPANFRQVKGIKYKRERINTPDKDFIDLDWSQNNNKQVALVLHGYEGHSYRDHILGMVRAFNKRGWDAVAMNQRGCSGEPNLMLKSYNGSSSDDLRFVVDHILSQRKYERIALVGFSLGTNIIIKYLGEGNVPDEIKNAACLSVPSDLKATAIQVSKNPIYFDYFISKLRKKVKAKMKIMPGKITDQHFKKIKTLMDYDEFYTAPLNGFKNADDYYKQSSCPQYLKKITIPLLILSAQNDPFLPEESYPVKEAEASENIYLEMPKSGGHTGFMAFNKEKEYWSETRVTDFIINGKV